MKVFLVFFAVFFLAPSLAAAFAFSQNLKMGSAGQAVLELQRVLNRDADTAVAEAGPGSPGLESGYFGRKTFEAVKRFQTKYRQDILWPLGLSEATGVVGVATKQKIAELAGPGGVSPLTRRPSPVAAPQNQTGLVLPPLLPAVLPSAIGPKSSALANPNFVNLDRFIADVEKVGKQKGYSDSRLRIIAEGIKTAAATTTDFRAAFSKAWSKTKSPPPLSKLSPRPMALGKFFRGLFKALGIFPAPALAKAGTPFGGAIYYVFLCDCSGDWLVGLQPLPPTFAALLTYYEGTQTFASYNAPFSIELLGDYAPGAGVCLEVAGPDCIEIPSEGMITGFLGSSPL